jgi:hypothetical protein
MTKRNSRRKRVQSLTLPELDQSKTAVLNSLGSLQSRRSYRYAMEEFIQWYCSEPRLALNRSVVLRYRLQLEGAQLAPATINVRLAAIVFRMPQKYIPTMTHIGPYIRASLV